MKLRTKIIIKILLFVILTTLSVTTIVVLDIKKKGNEEIVQYEIEEVARVKQELKNIVDIAYDTVQKNYFNAQNSAFLTKQYGHRLKNILDISFSILSENQKLVTSNKISLKEAQAESIRLLKNLRYNNSGYIWINSIDWPYPKMIMHPTKPELNGVVLSSNKYNCALGKNQNLFQAGVEKAVKFGDGFVDYKWDKPTKDGFIPDVQKLSYVKLYKPWNWVLGVGIYVDEALEEAKNNSKITIENMKYNNGAGYLFVINEQVECVMHPYKKELEGKNLKQIADPDGKNLFSEMAKVCKKNKSGFVEYRWAKPLKDGKEIPKARKITFVKSFEPWNWIIGSGVYIDQIEAKILVKKIEISISAPILLLIKKMKEIKISDLSDTKIDLKGSYEIKELGRIFNETTTNLHDAIEELKETTNAKERIEGELNVAREIQMNIVPNLFPALPEVPEFELFASIDSAKAVGGDLYDFFMIDDSHLCFAIGDVSGKGVPASLFMAITHTLLRAKTHSDFKPNEILQEMNKVLCKNNDSCMFVTFFLSILNIKTGVIEYTNAGHNLPFIIKGQNEIEELKVTHGPAIGVMDDIKYDFAEIKMKQSDSILLYTDGVTEATNRKNEMFETARLTDSLEKAKLLSPQGILNSITVDLDRFVKDAEQADDITMLALTYRG